MNVLETMLRELDIRFSHSFVTEIYTNAPDSDNMYGLHRALSRYSIETVGVHYDDKDGAGVTFPCIFHLRNKFVVGIDLEDGIIKYHDGKGIKEKESDSFNEDWTGDALLVSDVRNAKEPELFRNIATDIYKLSVRSFLIVLFSGLGIHSILRHGMVDSYSANVSFDLVGLSVCFLLFQKQLFKETTLVDNVCSVLQKGGCDSILQSDEAKFLGIVSWTEIGLVYFSSRLLCCFASAHSMGFLQLIGWAAMPYGIWSVWYQARKARKWCALCLATQMVVWIAGMYNVFAFQGICISISDVLTYAVCAMVVSFLVHIVSELYSIRDRHYATNKDFLSFKLQEPILKAALQESKKIDVDDDDSSIFYGSKSASIKLTVLSNPHCAPCAMMHKRLMHLIDGNRNLRVQFTYSSFNEHLEFGSLFMIAVYQQKPRREAMRILEEWYEHGKSESMRFVESCGVDIGDRRVLDEYARHTRWRERTGIKATPTIIFSGHELPSTYSVEDLIYLDM